MCSCVGLSSGAARRAAAAAVAAVAAATAGVQEMSSKDTNPCGY